MRKNNGVGGVSARPLLSASRSSRKASTRGEKRSSLSRRSGSLDDDMTGSPADWWLVHPQLLLGVLAVLLVVLFFAGRFLLIFLLRLLPLRFGKLLQTEQFQRLLLFLGRHGVLR